RSVLATLPTESVLCVVTSPPYHGLRDYVTEGQIGLESSADEHIAALVEVFALVKRCLRKDGVLAINYGDAYATQPSGPPGKFARGEEGDGAYKRRYDRMIGDGPDP